MVTEFRIDGNEHDNSERLSRFVTKSMENTKINHNLQDYKTRRRQRPSIKPYWAKYCRRSIHKYHFE